MQSGTYTDGMRLADEVLHRDHETTLLEWLTASRDRGDSYEIIARELTSTVRVPGFSVTLNTARRWCLRLGLDEESASASHAPMIDGADLTGRP